MAASLLIGVSQYNDAHLSPLPATAKDVDALQEVLRHPDIGAQRSAQVSVLKDATLAQMRSAIEAFYSNRQPNELVLLYFSGYGIVDDRGRLFLVARNTDPNHLDQSSLSIAELEACLEVCRSQQQVIILDCCFSGTFSRGMVASADIDTIGKQLSGKRRAVLTSPWSIDYTPSDKSAEISLYTQFLLNGLETGMADGAIPNRNLNGEITAIELHAYISDRLSEEAPALHPQFYAVGQGNEIKIANAPYLDFRREALGLAIPGEISPVGHSILDAMGQRLGMPEAVDKDIRKDALRPYQLKTQKQKQLEQLQTQMTEREGELSDNTRTELRRLQEMYDLKTEPPTRSSEAAAAIADTRLDPPRALVPFEQHPPIPSEPLDEEPGSNPFSRLWQDNIIQERGLTPDLLRMALASVAVLGLAGLVLWVALQPFSNNRPATFAGYFQEGYQEASRNDRKDAITAYTEAIKLDPENAAAYYNRGIEYAKQNDRNQAIQDYTDAIKLSPNFADAYFNRANSYFVRGEKDAAIQDYRKAAQLYQKLNRIDDRKRALDAIQIAQRQP